LKLLRRIAAAAPIALIAAGCGGPPETPGLLLVTIDTCRADRIGCYGGGHCETPAIDALAARGTVFLDASAPAPLTLPSHCSILTGLYPDRHTLRDNGVGRLPDEAVTLAEILRERGWRTAAFVSAVPVEREFGTDQGFEIYDDELTGSGGGDGDDHAREVAERFFFDERVGPETADAAVPWLREAAAAGDPFFAWVHFFDPHAVYRPTGRHAQRYGPGSYEGEVSLVDEQVGRLVEALGDAGDRVTVVVTADHGEALGEHEERSHGLFLYQATLHVPWVMAGPAVPSGRRVAGAVSLVDVLPTVLDALGAPVPEGIDGTSRLAEAAAGRVDADDTFAESLLPRFSYDWAGLRSVRSGRWKLIDAPRAELYDLETDPRETRNVADEHPDVAAKLREALLAHYARGGELRQETADVDPLVREQLARLGYVGVPAAPDSTPEDELWGPGRDPKDMVDFFNRFQEVPTMMMDGRDAEAERTLLELRAEDPGNLRVLERLGVLRRTQERWEDVRDVCLEYLAQDPGDRPMRRNLAHARRQLGDVDGALADYRDLAAAEPGDAEAWMLLGSLLSETGRHDEALEVLRSAAELAPESAAAHATLARAWEDSGAPAPALEAYDRALALEPALSEAVNGKALLLSHEGRAAEAAQVLEAGLAAAPDDLDALNNLAWILVNEGLDPERGLEIARRAAAIAPDDPAVLDTLGWAAIRAGSPADGVAALERAWELTRDPEVRAHLGIALAESGREEEGRRHVRAAVDERASLASLPEVARWR
jgi:arylsulfatase A-like enzyme/Flp pilus assembly protein TadD